MFRKGKEEVEGLSEEEQKKKQFNNMLDIFADKGLRYYLHLVFSYDIDFRKRLELACCVYEKTEINRKLGLLSKIKKQDKLGSQEYRDIASQLEELRANPSGLTVDVPKRLEESVLKYFSSGKILPSVKIRVDYPGHNSEEGYYINWETHEFKYRDSSGKEFMAGCFSEENKMKELFPQLDPEKRGLFNSKQSRTAALSKNMGLSPELFVKIYENLNLSDGAVFHKHITPEFMKVFYEVKKLNMANSVLSGRGGYKYESLESLAQEMIDMINARIEEFNRSCGNEPNSLKRQTIMNAIGDYVNGEIDKTEFTKIVAKNDRGFFARLFSRKDSVDKTLELVKRLDSEFLEKGIKYVTKKSKSKSKASAEVDQPMDIPLFSSDNLYENAVSEFWKGSFVSKSKFILTLESMLEKLETVGNQHESILSQKITFPVNKNITLSDTGTGQIASSSEQLQQQEDTYQDEEGELQLDKSEIESTQTDGKTIVEYLRELISDEKTQLMSTKNPNREDKEFNYSEYCISLEQSISKMLDYRYQSAESLIAQTEEVRGAHIDLNLQLVGALREAKNLPSTKTQVIVSPGQIKKEIVRLQKDVLDIENKLQEFSQALHDISQGTLENKLRSFISDKLKERRDFLQDMFAFTHNCHEVSFDMNMPNENQKPVVKAITKIKANSEDFMNELSAFFTGDDIKYISVHSSVDDANSKIFQNLIKDIKNYLDSKEFFNKCHPAFILQQQKVSGSMTTFFGGSSSSASGNDENDPKSSLSSGSLNNP